MSSKTDAVKLKQVRQLILGNLNRLYPTPLQVRTLFRVMCSFDENYDMSLLEKDLTYLKDKGYVKYIDDALGGSERFEQKCIGLTAEGKEITDRTQTDPALEI